MDLNGDGHLDLISGSYTGEIYVFDGVPSEGASPRFERGRYLMASDGEPLKVASSVTPETLDMDADGDLDLVIGTRSSGVFVIWNRGSDADPVWDPKKTALETSEGKRIKGSNAHHADWDGDGDLDLVVGSERGGANWYPNISDGSVPVYGPVQILVERAKYEERSEDDGPEGPGLRTKLHVTDWNGDGQLDLLMGDVQWLIRTRPPLTPEQEAAKAALQPAFDEAQAHYDLHIGKRNSFVGKPGGIPDDVLAAYKQAGDAFKVVARKMAVFDRTEHMTHGWVWLFLRGTAPPVPTVSEKPTISEKVVGQKSQGPTVLEVRTGSESSESETTVVTVHLSIDPGWHVYESVEPDSGYVVAEPRLELPEGVEVTQSWSTNSVSVEGRLGKGARWFEDELTYRCEIRLGGADPSDVRAGLHFQVCDRKMCMPPTTWLLPLE